MPTQLALTFPSFNLYSMPLLILVVQGYVFSLLLLLRYIKKRQTADLILALLLFLTGFERTMYIIGFMDWYDTYRNTKINYFLIDTYLAFGPLIYFYVKSITKTKFKFRKIDILHFVPFLSYFVFRVVIYLHDRVQPGFADQQNGDWLRNIEFKYLDSIYGILVNISLTLYLAFAIQAFYHYRQKIKQYFSNTYKVQLNWLLAFLAVFSTLFVITFVTYQIHNNIVELHWKQRWWAHFAAALALVYLGTYGYFTDLSNLYSLQLEATGGEDLLAKPIPTKQALVVQDKDLSALDQDKDRLRSIMESGKAYLNPDLTLSLFAKEVGMPSQQLSQLINNGFQVNFKDFVNSYRVEAVKEAIRNGMATQLSLLGIALECGFNSKATFNRTFKKFTQQSPSEYLQQINEEKQPNLTD